MDLLNLKVKHKTFGNGKITVVNGNYLTIEFGSKVSNFVYPDSFEKFLEAEDVLIQNAIVKEINNAKQFIKEKYQQDVNESKGEEKSYNTEMQTTSITRKNRRVEDGFDSNYNVKFLSKHTILTYQQVEEQFGIKILGFGRVINRTPSTVILISSVYKKKSGFLYHDHWTKEGDYIYSGEGKTGDQKITLGNKAIIEAKNDEKQIHLFVKFSPKEYYYQGVFELVDYTYEDDKDEAGNIRKEYKFRLRKQPIKE